MYQIAANQAQEQICVTTYGGGVVCGVHTPINAGVGGFSLVLLGAGLILASFVILYFSRKLKARKA